MIMDDNEDDENEVPLLKELIVYLSAITQRKCMDVATWCLTSFIKLITLFNFNFHIIENNNNDKNNNNNIYNYNDDDGW